MVACAIAVPSRGSCAASDSVNEDDQKLMWTPVARHDHRVRADEAKRSAAVNTSSDSEDGPSVTSSTHGQVADFVRGRGRVPWTR